MRFAAIPLCACACACACALTAAHAQAPAPQDGQRPGPIPTGVVPLPAGGPSIGSQGRVPSPSGILPMGDHPMLWSPKLEDIKGFVAKQPITLDQATAIALYTSRSFATSVTNLVQAAARAGEARAQLFPTLGVQENLTYYDKATTANLGALAGGGTSTTTTTASPPLVVLPQFNPIFTAALNLPVDIFGSLRSASGQAKLNEVAARIDVNKVRNQVVYDVKDAFYAVLRASAQVAVAQDTLNSSLQTLDDANKNYAAGTAPRFDITTAQRDVADAQQSVIAAQSQVSINISKLKNTMGLDPTTRLSVKTDGAVEFPNGVEREEPTAAKPPPDSQNPEIPHAAPSVANDMVKPEGGRFSAALDPRKNSVVADDFDFGPEYQALIDEALKNRPEVLEADAQIKAGQKGLQYALRSSLPSFSFGVEDIYTANSTPLERKNQEALTFNISVPIFDGGLAGQMAKEQHAVIAQAQLNRRNAEDQVKVDVQQAYIALNQARQKVAVAQVEVTSAKEAFRVSQVRYRAGVTGDTSVSPQLEISNAQTTLAQAESNLVNSLYDYNGARAQLDRAAGRYSFTGIGPGYPNRAQIPTVKK